MLRTIITGEATDRPPVLIAHGLYGSGRNWGVIAKRLSDTRQVIAVDMRNHGESPWFETHSYFNLANDLSKVIAEIGQPVDLLGHSMGGKAAMVLAVTEPAKINRLVIADISPIAYTHTQVHLAEAMQNLDFGAIASRSDADLLLADVIPESAIRSFLLQSVDIKEKKWRLNLEVLTREMDKIIGFPSLAGQFDGPTLFLSGGDSDYVRAEYRPEIKRLFPKARFAKIPGAGHWLHAEKPREFEATSRVFFEG